MAAEKRLNVLTGESPWGIPEIRICILTDLHIRLIFEAPQTCIGSLLCSATEKRDLGLEALWGATEKLHRSAQASYFCGTAKKRQRRRSLRMNNFVAPQRNATLCSNKRATLWRHRSMQMDCFCVVREKHDFVTKLKVRLKRKNFCHSLVHATTNKLAISQGLRLARYNRRLLHVKENLRNPL